MAVIFIAGGNQNNNNTIIIIIKKRHDIAEILLKVALNTINPIPIIQYLGNNSYHNQLSLLS
jgi:hypothetical protein